MPIPDAQHRIVVCDASPLIFLAKLDALELLGQVVPGRLIVLQQVWNEIMSEQAGPAELDRLREWMEDVEVVDCQDRFLSTSVLSLSDQSTLAWAVKNDAAWMVADERLLRGIALQRGIRVIGFCGILVKAVERGLLAASKARMMLDAAVDHHGLRISIALYRRIMEALAGSGG